MNRRPVWGQDHQVHAQRTPSLAQCGALLARPLLEANSIPPDVVCPACFPRAAT